MKNLLIEPLEARIAPATLSITAVNPGGVNEGDATGAQQAFRVTLTDDAPGRTDLITVDYWDEGWHRDAGKWRLLELRGTLVFSRRGETEKLINVAITGDLQTSPTRPFRYPGEANQRDDRDKPGVGTIIDDDPTPELRVSDVTISEGNSGQKEAVFTVSFTGKAPGRVFCQLRDREWLSDWHGGGHGHR
jgi:serralysin